MSKITIIMKDPDGVYDSCLDYAEENNLDVNDVIDDVSQWFRYGEYLTVEIDLETREAKIV